MPVEILVGKYSVAASVAAANVKDYAGQEDSTGGNFVVTYYIQQQHGQYGQYPSWMTEGPVLGLPSSNREPAKVFQAWASKRSLPSYLK